MKSREWRASIALRLTLWYAAVFAATSVLAMALVYSSVARSLRADGDAELRADLDELATLVIDGGPAAFRAEVAGELAGADSADAFFRLWNAAGEPVASVGFRPPDEARVRAARERGASPEGARAVLSTVPVPGREDDVRAGMRRAGPGHVVEIGQSLEESSGLLAELRSGILVALPAVLLLSVPLGAFLSRRALRAVGHVTDAAVEIASGALDRRVQVGAGDSELDRMARAFNAMLDRIEALLGGMRAVTDSLAHDLRTPLARMRAAAEHAAASDASREEWLAYAETTIEECDRILGVVDATLEIEEAEAGATVLRRRDVDLAELLEEAREVFATLAEDAGVVLELGTAAPCVVRADRSRIQRVVANLVDNAVKHTPRGGRVTLDVAEEGRHVRVRVADTGAGIPPEELPRVFDRFYRGDGSRTGRGNGLGLSLARAFVRAHGGELTAESTPGTGSAFTFRLPR